MFTGIIQSVGCIETVQRKNNDLRMIVNIGKLPVSDLAPGDSVAVSGICLTVVEKTTQGFLADVSGETLSRTVAGRWQAGERVNLELALTPTTRLGGHLVSGHVDGIGEVIKRWSDGRSERFVIGAPAGLAKYIAEKGSISVDGVSLTVNTVSGSEFELNIVPHTLRETTMGDYAPGRKVNLEVDIIARYLERLLLGGKAAEKSQSSAQVIDEAFLSQHGFIK
ncbi:MAG: riboflavin synthase [Gammaproteobacteria bacterium]|nr:riboflavin synthase [Gammaproteobacteria bacterium]